jgi:hypothetical protein
VSTSSSRPWVGPKQQKRATYQTPSTRDLWPPLPLKASAVWRSRECLFPSLTTHPLNMRGSRLLQPHSGGVKLARRLRGRLRTHFFVFAGGVERAEIEPRSRGPEFAPLEPALSAAEGREMEWRRSGSAVSPGPFGGAQGRLRAAESWVGQIGGTESRRDATLLTRLVSDGCAKSHEPEPQSGDTHFKFA